MLEILKASKIFPNQRLPPVFEDITGLVEIVHVPGKGRGLLAQQNFEPGDLILCHRALGISFQDPATGSSSLLNRVKKFRLLKESIASLALNDESLRRKLYSLHAGPKLGFVCDSGKTVSQDKISVSRIEGILIVNGFQGSSQGSVEGPFGLWYLPSFVNHDCYKSNANWSVVCDFMFIRASKSISIGEEILTSYIDPDQPHFVKKELFSKHDFVCLCKLCGLERQEGDFTVRKRDDILSEFKTRANSGTLDCHFLQETVKELKSLRPKNTENPFCIQPLMQLGLLHYETGEYSEAITEFQNAIEICKAFPQFIPVASTLCIAILNCYLKLEEVSVPGSISTWLEELKSWMHIQYGCAEGSGEWMEILTILHPNFACEIKQLIL